MWNILVLLFTKYQYYKNLFGQLSIFHLTLPLFFTVNSQNVVNVKRLNLNRKKSVNTHQTTNVLSKKGL